MNKLLTQAWLIMRLAAFIVLVGTLHLSAASYSQTITYAAEKTSIRSVLHAIEQQTGFVAFTSEDLLKNTSPVSVQFKKTPIEEVLQTLFSNQPLTYEIKGKNILIREAPRSLLREGLVLAYTEVRGKVVDSVGNPLAGASVRVLNAEGKRTTLQTTTDREGEFMLQNVPEDATVQITYLGYVGQTRKAAADMGNIMLKIQESLLDETVVQAYGTTTRRLNTGNISRVGAEDIASHPVSNVLGVLDGQVPGMLVTQSNGLPGASFKVQVRGRTAIDQNITDDQPLFIIDGVPYAPNNDYFTQISSSVGNPSAYATYPGGISPLNLINPQDIESVEVLKDADATAIYGSRGANGVVLITTKSGGKRTSGTEVHFQTYHGVSVVPKLPEMMDIHQYVAIRKQALILDGEIPTEANAYDILLWDTTYNNDVYNQIFGNNAHSNDYQLSVSGGAQNTTFNLSGNYHRETNMFTTDKADKRGTFHLGLQHQSPNNRLHLTFNGSYTSNNNNQITENMGRSYYMPPHQRLYNNDGTLTWEQNGIINYTNPMSSLYTDYLAKSTAALGNLLVDYEILNGLHLKMSSGYNNINIDETSLRFSAADMSGRRFASFANGRLTSWMVEPQLEYRLAVNQNRFTLLLGGTWQENKNNSTYTQASGFTNDALMNSISNASSIYTSRSQSAYRYSAGFARLTYHYDNKYLVNASIRRDGSSRFGTGKQLATFSAVGLGWIFSSERWMQEQLQFLSFGKIRGSYGITGNDKISDYQYLDTWASGMDNYSGMIGLYPDKLFNPDYRWEKTIKAEAGLELGFLRDRILLSASYYRNSSSNQLVNYKLPTVTGFANVIANLNAEVRNTGWEFILNTTNIAAQDFSWKSSFNVSLPKNKLVSFPGLATSPYYSQYIIGQPLNISTRLYRYTGVDPETGIYTAVDVNQDGQMNLDDRTERVKLDASLFGGFKNTLVYRQFSLDFLFSFRKQKGRNYLYYIEDPGMMNNIPAILYDQFWREPGQRALLQRPTQSYSSEAYNARNYFQTSNASYSDASFIRLRNVSLSYNLPVPSLQRLRITNARLYLQAENLFRITPYELGDPEVGAYYIVPPLRTIVVGVQFGLQ